MNREVVSEVPDCFNPRVYVVEYNLAERFSNPLDPGKILPAKKAFACCQPPTEGMRCTNLRCVGAQLSEAGETLLVFQGFCPDANKGVRIICSLERSQALLEQCRQLGVEEITFN